MKLPLLTSSYSSCLLLSNSAPTSNSFQNYIVFFSFIKCGLSASKWMYTPITSPHSVPSKLTQDFTYSSFHSWVCCTSDWLSCDQCLHMCSFASSILMDIQDSARRMLSDQLLKLVALQQMARVFLVRALLVQNNSLHD